MMGRLCGWWWCFPPKKTEFFHVWASLCKSNKETFNNKKTVKENVRNTAYFEQMFIIREVNSDMPIYILTEQMSEKIKCPERDSNPRQSKGKDNLNT